MHSNAHIRCMGFRVLHVKWWIINEKVAWLYWKWKMHAVRLAFSQCGIVCGKCMNGITCAGIQSESNWLFCFDSHWWSFFQLNSIEFRRHKINKCEEIISLFESNKCSKTMIWWWCEPWYRIQCNFYKTTEASVR